MIKEIEDKLLKSNWNLKHESDGLNNPKKAIVPGIHYKWYIHPDYKSINEKLIKQKIVDDIEVVLNMNEDIIVIQLMGKNFCKTTSSEFDKKLNEAINQRNSNNAIILNKQKNDVTNH